MPMWAWPHITYCSRGLFVPIPPSVVRGARCFSLARSMADGVCPTSSVPRSQSLRLCRDLRPGSATRELQELGLQRAYRLEERGFVPLLADHGGQAN